MRKKTYRPLILLYALLSVACLAPAVHAGDAGTEARHIVLIIGDGMQPDNEIALSRYLHGGDEGLSFHGFPYRGVVSTWDVTTYNRQASRYDASAYDPSAVLPRVGCAAAKAGTCPSLFAGDDICYSCLIPGQSGQGGTDSAAAATAWTTGQKTDAGKIAWRHGDSHPGALKTLAELLRERRGFSIGIVSTDPFSHATPAAHVSHNKSRGNYHAIADEIVRTVRPDVVIGGGHPVYDGAKHMSMTLYNDIKTGAVDSYVFVERREGVDAGKSLRDAAAEASVKRKKLFGLFGGNDGYIDAPAPAGDGTALFTRRDIESPSLAASARAALDALGKNRSGFFLLVEQGGIDRANHANDYRRMIGAMQDLDEAVRAVVEFVNRPGDGITWANTLLIVTADHATGAMRLADGVRLGRGRLPEQKTGLCPDRPTLCPRYPGGEVRYESTGHTNDPVRLYAMGSGGLTKHLQRLEGHWYPCTRMIDNTQLFHAMTAAAGIPQPPSLTVMVNRPEFCPPRTGNGK